MKQTAFLTHIIFLLCVNFLIAQKKSSKDDFYLNGKIIGQSDGFVYLHYTDKNGKHITDSCLVKDGSFHFEGQINGPTCAYFTDKTNARFVDDPNFVDVFIDPTNMEATFEVGNFKHAKMIGSRSQNDFMATFRANEKVQEKWKPMLDQMMDARHKNENEKSDSIRNIFYASFLAERNQTDYNFIINHPDSYVSPYLFTYFNLKHYLTLDSLKMFYANFSPPIKQSAYGKELLDYITTKEKIAIDKPAPNFLQFDSLGNAVTLKDFNGKYVLLEFWASWCAPCRAENPNLLNAYNQYKAKGFTILGISIDNEKQKNAWLAAINKDGLLWPQVCDFKAWQSSIIRNYNLLGKGIPSNFLIDPAGKIIDIDLRGDDLNKKLAELLAKNNL